MIRRTLAVLAATLALVLAGVGATYATADDTTVALAPNGGAISATLTIDGRTVTGTATGMDPDRRYISLYYGSMSTDQPGTTLTCADARTAAAPRAWGISPEWNVSPDGEGTLTGTAPRDVEDGVYTVSVRMVPMTAGDDPYVLFDPVRYPVVACGKVRDGALPLPTVTNPLSLLPLRVGF